MNKLERLIERKLKEKVLEEALIKMFKDSLKSIERYSIVQTLVKTFCVGLVCALATLKFSFPEIYSLLGKQFYIYIAIFMPIAYFIDCKMNDWILRAKLRICATYDYYYSVFSKELLDSDLVEDLKLELYNEMDQEILQDYYI